MLISFMGSSRQRVSLAGVSQGAANNAFRRAAGQDRLADMIRARLLLLLGAIPAFVIVLLVCLNARYFFGWVTLPADDAADRLAFAVRWLLLPGIALLIGVQFAGRRFVSPELLEGTRTPTDRGFEINLRYNTNTLEQVVLAAIAWNGLALALPQDRLVLIPGMAFLFFVGRITFWISYRIHPLARSFGMVLTALPTVAAYLWLIFHAVRG
jgi:hypothetical protein